MPVFDPYSKFMTVTNTILDYVKIGLLFLLFSIPVVTIGASLAAGMSVAMKIERGEAPVIRKPFQKAFRENLKQSIVPTVLMEILFGLLLFDWYQILQMEETLYVKLARVGIVVLVLVLVIIFIYFFAIMARFELKNRAILHNAMIYTILNFPKNLVGVAILLVGLLAYDYLKTIVPIVICFAPALEFYYMAKVCEKSFRNASQE
jgi:uncharacterized membrane protein YesL